MSEEKSLLLERLNQIFTLADRAPSRKIVITNNAIAELIHFANIELKGYREIPQPPEGMKLLDKKLCKEQWVEGAKFFCKQDKKWKSWIRQRPYPDTVGTYANPLSLIAVPISYHAGLDQKGDLSVEMTVGVKTKISSGISRKNLRFLGEAARVIAYSNSPGRVWLYFDHCRGKGFCFCPTYKSRCYYLRRKES